MKINTGNFRICKHQIEIEGSIILLLELSDRNEAVEKMRKIGDFLNWEYYCEEEVIDKEALFDSNNNQIDALPNWVRIVV